MMTRERYAKTVTNVVAMNSKNNVFWPLQKKKRDKKTKHKQMFSDTAGNAS